VFLGFLDSVLLFCPAGGTCRSLCNLHSDASHHPGDATHILSQFIHTYKQATAAAAAASSKQREARSTQRRGRKRPAPSAGVRMSSEDDELNVKASQSEDEEWKEYPVWLQARDLGNLQVLMRCHWVHQDALARAPRRADEPEAVGCRA
jgi:hypothetical protein